MDIYTPVVRMNYFFTALILSASLLAASPMYKAVCKTEYSFVLKLYHDTSNRFQNNIWAIERCIENDEDLELCFERLEVHPPYSNYFLFSRYSYARSIPLSVQAINEIHADACHSLNQSAARDNFVKDIQLREYDVFEESGSIKEYLNDTVKIGINIDTDNEEVSSTINRLTSLATQHFDQIFECVNVHGHIDYDRCVKDFPEPELVDCMNQFRRFFAGFGGPSAIDKLNLKIFINKWLNDKVNPPGGNDNVPVSNLDDFDIGDFEMSDDGWFWVKVGFFAFIIVIIVSLTAFCFKRAASNDEEKGNSVSKSERMK